MFAPHQLHRAPNALAQHYARFRVADRLLLTGHSHQAWPDCALEGQLEAFEDAAVWVDDKWERALERADRVRDGFASLLGDANGDIALGASTHELIVRFLSALPLEARPRIVTTDAEFQSLQRQLTRLGEEGIEIVRVPHDPVSLVAERLSACIDERTAAAMISAVFYTSAQIVPGLARVMERCERVGTALLVDAYHALNVVPFTIRAQGLAGAFVVGGGYKYCQLGEGNCFLRLPPSCELRPVVTGWFSELERLSAGDEGVETTYGPGAARFAGATYDPTSHYRASRVFDFFESHGLTPAFLREVSQHQVALLMQRFDALDADPRIIERDRSVPLTELAGFLALRSPRAAEICGGLRALGIAADFRGECLRFGPAPYLSDEQLCAAMGGLGEVVSDLASEGPILASAATGA